ALFSTLEAIMSNYLNTCKQSQPIDQFVEVLPTHPALSALVNGSLTNILRIWFQRHQQRRKLADLSLRMLKDVGITPEQAARESRKPFWVR
ncbi:MAG: DUF1127 domain-containing protein, partial [bacterium]